MSRTKNQIKKTFIPLLAFLLTTSYSKSQSFEWAKAIIGPGDGDVWSVATDEAGNVFIAGSFYGILDFDPGPDTYNLFNQNYVLNSFICKLDVDGKFLWVKRLDGGLNRTFSMLLGPDGSVYLTGMFIETLDFDPGANSFNLTANGYPDVFVLKLDNNGNFIWAKNMGGYGSDYGITIKLDSHSNVYISGTSPGGDFNPGLDTFDLKSLGSNDIFLSKLNGNGNFLWAKMIGTTGNDESVQMAVDANGDIFNVGNVPTKIFFDKDVVISKTSSSGNPIWEKTIGSGTNQELGSAIATDQQGNVYVAGVFQTAVDFDPGTGVHILTPTGNQNAFILKLDPVGNFMWAKAFQNGSTVITSMVIDNKGNIFTTGQFSGTVDFDPGAAVLTLKSEYSESGFICALGASGNFIWAENIKANSSSYVTPTSISLDNKGSILVGGYFLGSFDANPGADTFLVAADGSADLFVLKWKGKSCSQVVGFPHVTTIKPGLWNDPAIWSNNKVPDANSYIVVRHDVMVSQPATCKYLLSLCGEVRLGTGISFVITGSP